MTGKGRKEWQVGIDVTNVTQTKPNLNDTGGLQRTEQTAVQHTH